MKHNVCVHPLRRVSLKLPKLPHHTMWQMKLNCPHTYHWTPHMPKMPFRSTHWVHIKFKCKIEIITNTVWLPYHLKVSAMYSCPVQENERNDTCNDNRYLLGGKSIQLVDVLLVHVVHITLHLGYNVPLVSPSGLTHHVLFIVPFLVCHTLRSSNWQPLP